MRRACFLLLIALVATGVAHAQDAAENNEQAPQRENAAPEAPPEAPPEAAPEADAEAGAEVSITVLEVEGRVFHRDDAEADWQPLAEGDELSIGTVVRTMLRSMARLQMGPDTTVVLDQLGTIALKDFAVEQGVLHTHILKKYGRVRFDVGTDGPFDNDFQIATPGSVLAVRGTSGSHSEYDRLEVHGESGVFVLDRPGGRVYLLGPEDLVNDQMLAWVAQFIDALILEARDPNLGFGALQPSEKQITFLHVERLIELRESFDSQRESDRQADEMITEEGEFVGTPPLSQ
ncbi:MAG: FecR domain-containing protein [Phycisphaeraceae bacterium]